MERCELHISTMGLHHNIRLVRRLAGSTKIIGVVKGNGYGLGLAELAGQLVDYGIRRLAVSELSEGLELRRLGVPAQVMLLTPLYDPADLEEALRCELTLCIDSKQAACAAREAAQRLAVAGRGQLCIDTGFGRYGFAWDDSSSVIEAAESLGNVRIVGTYSHLSRSGSLVGSFTVEQHRRLSDVCEQLKAAGIDPGLRHLADSYGMLLHPDICMDGVRIGSAFLGRLPFPDRWGFSCIGTLSAPVREVRTLRPGSTVGYGSTYVADRSIRIAVVGAGYSHGLGMAREKPVSKGGVAGILRLLRSKTPAPLQAFSGERGLNVLGPVGMCATVVDASETSLQVGDRVELPVNPLFVNPEVPRCYI